MDIFFNNFKGSNIKNGLTKYEFYKLVKYKHLGK